MADILDKITHYKLDEIARAKAARPLQVIAEYARSELWYGGEPHPAADARAALRFDSTTDTRVLWERMEALGIESGRLGSERAR